MLLCATSNQTQCPDLCKQPPRQPGQLACKTTGTLSSNGKEEGGGSTLLGSSREVSSSLDSWHSWPTKPGCVHWPRCASDTDAGAGGVEGGEVASLAACCPDCVPTIVCQPGKLFQTTWRSGGIRDLFVFSVQYLTPTTSLTSYQLLQQVSFPAWIKQGSTNESMSSCHFLSWYF